MARVAKEQLRYSAKFKRDYVAMLAVAIFFAIIFCEGALAVSIPAYLHKENAMALEVRRLQLLESFDGARSLANNVKPAQEAAELEARLLRWDLNLLANYLRTEAPKLTSSEISELQATVRDITYFLARLREGRSFCSERKLDTSIYMDSLLEASAAKQ